MPFFQFVRSADFNSGLAGSLAVTLLSCCRVWHGGHIECICLCVDSAVLHGLQIQAGAKPS